LTGVDGTPLHIFGQFQGLVEVKALRRNYKVNFIATDTRPILGADFLTQYGLKLDMKNRKLTDPLANISVNLVSGDEEAKVVRVKEDAGSNSFILKHFPRLLTSPNYEEIPDTVPFHEIKTTGPPLFAKPRPLSPKKLEIAKDHFNLLIKTGVVRPSSSPWASPLHLVPKGDGEWRPCGDYRRLNAVTVPDRYAIPNLQTVHYKLANSKVYSTLDLVKAYHYIPIKKEDIEKTAICTPFGNFEYLRMPFGLRNASSSFQRFVDGIFRDLPFVVVYIDDILIFSNSIEEHKEHLEKVLSRLDSVNLKIKGSKSSLFQDKVNFLGYQFSKEGIKPIPEKVKCLLDLPNPSNTKVLQRYMGMFNFYQRCIPRYSDKSKNLRDLLNSQEFLWKSIHQEEFDNLKLSIKEASELSYPSPNANFTVTADASSYAIGACLHQVVDGICFPLCFFSRKMSDAERRYSTFDRELLAIFCALKKWRDLISGSQVTIFTDHKPLVGALQSGKPRTSDRQQRQLSFINEFTSDIVHISGKENVVADTLSRSDLLCSFSDVESCSIPSSSCFDLFSLAKAQAASDIDFSGCKGFKLDKNVQLFCDVSQPNPRPYVPFRHRKLVFEFLHNLSHPGIKASIRTVGSRYFWPELKNDVKKWVSECLLCQKAKVNRHTHRPPGFLPCPTQRFTIVHIDIVGPLPAEVGSPRYLLTMIDSFTRWIEVFPLVEITALNVCKGFLFSWVSRFGPPLTLISDKGKQFCSELMSNMNKVLGINMIRTTSYNPKANGLVERFHRTLKAALMTKAKSWLEELPIVILGIRMFPDAEGESAFSKVYGEQPLMPRVVVQTGTTEDLRKSLHGLKFSYNVPRSRNTESQVSQKLMSCSHVWLRIDRVKKALEAPYRGPYEVLERCPQTFKLKIRDKAEVVSIERLKPAQLPQNKEDKLKEKEKATTTEDIKPVQEAEKTMPTATRSGRKVKFASKADYINFN